MAGNVCQRCWDWYGAYSSGSQTDPHGPLAGSIRVMRGGSWYNHGDISRCANRYPYNPPFDYFQELRTIVELLYPLQLESEQLISAKPAALEDFEHGVIQLYRNAKREGVVV